MIPAKYWLEIDHGMILKSKFTCLSLATVHFVVIVAVVVVLV